MRIALALSLAALVATGCGPKKKKDGGSPAPAPTPVAAATWTPPPEPVMTATPAATPDPRAAAFALLDRLDQELGKLAKAKGHDAGTHAKTIHDIVHDLKAAMASFPSAGPIQASLATHAEKLEAAAKKHSDKDIHHHGNDLGAASKKLRAAIQ